MTNIDLNPSQLKIESDIEKQMEVENIDLISVDKKDGDVTEEPLYQKAWIETDPLSYFVQNAKVGEVWKLNFSSHHIFVVLFEPIRDIIHTVAGDDRVTAVGKWFDHSDRQGIPGYSWQDREDKSPWAFNLNSIKDAKRVATSIEEYKQLFPERFASLSFESDIPKTAWVSESSQTWQGFLDTAYAGEVWQFIEPNGNRGFYCLPIEAPKETTEAVANNPELLVNPGLRRSTQEHVYIRGYWVNAKATSSDVVDALSKTPWIYIIDFRGDMRAGVTSTFERIASTFDEFKHILETRERSATSSLSIEADLYHDKVFTVIPKDADEKLGIFPEDQGFSDKRVFVWDNYQSLLKFSDEDWKKFEVTLPPGSRHHLLTPLVGGAYTLKMIPNTWKLEEQKSRPRYIV